MLWVLTPLCAHLRRAQAYVGAFLRRTPEPAAESEAEAALAASDIVKAAKEAAEGPAEGSGDAADYLHRIGTFAQARSALPASATPAAMQASHRFCAYCPNNVPIARPSC